jgi:hypothetical protein
MADASAVYAELLNSLDGVALTICQDVFLACRYVEKLLRAAGTFDDMRVLRGYVAGQMHIKPGPDSGHAKTSGLLLSNEAQ